MSTSAMPRAPHPHQELSKKRISRTLLETDHAKSLLLGVEDSSDVHAAKRPKKSNSNETFSQHPVDVQEDLSSHHLRDSDHEKDTARSVSLSESEQEARYETPDDSHPHDGVPAHPLDIKPLGNLYSAAGPSIKKYSGLFSRLPDEIILQLLEYICVPELLSLGGTCKALYAFCRHDEIWRALFVETPPSSFRWQGTWRNTYLNISPSRNPSIRCTGLYSDALYCPFFCAHTPLAHYAQNIPLRNAIPRLTNLSHAEFTNDGWADKPFILTEPVKAWPAYRRWSAEYLQCHYADTAFRAEAVDWPLATYMEYMKNNSDESPLYLFDSHFAEKMSLDMADTANNTTKPSSQPQYDPIANANPEQTPETEEPAYTPPPTFGPDLFAHLHPHRPHNKWLILGPARSGSTFHKDPNGTSAWNAVLTGSKYWLMFPSLNPTTGRPSPAPPGVYLSPDASEITSPLSIPEYLLNFHFAARASTHCREGICKEGEMLHVPSGWFHLVLNLEESLAITQNFVPEAHLEGVLRFLRDTPGQISGFAGDVGVGEVFGLFVERLRERALGVLEGALTGLEKRGGREERGGASKWEKLTKGVEEGEGGGRGAGDGGFSFGFDGDDVDVNGEDEAV